ncbi:MAG: nucleotidyltransferase family protein [Clostridia bacterium]|nr:nucleotidyltransferase family protein [Clostridia bacterium]MBC7346672.1 nucleotidyltransferase family protein [Clostridia bacterium]
MGIEEIKKAVAPILRRYGVAKAYLFGSYARGEETEGSDVDFLVEYAPGARKSLLSHVRMVNELKEALKAEVDVVTEAALRPEIREEVLRERRAIM